MSRPGLGALPRALPITVVLPLAATVVGLLIGVGLVDASWRDRLPAELADRLQELLDNPNG